jgi:hypothetical protein
MFANVSEAVIATASFDALIEFHPITTTPAITIVDIIDAQSVASKNIIKIKI